MDPLSPFHIPPLPTLNFNKNQQAKYKAKKAFANFSSQLLKNNFQQAKDKSANDLAGAISGSPRKPADSLFGGGGGGSVPGGQAPDPNANKGSNNLANSTSFEYSRNVPHQKSFGSWDPKGSYIHDPHIGSTEHQVNTGDCGALAVLHGMSTTSQGRQTLWNSIKKDSNGNYEVMFAGDPKRQVFTVTPKDLNEKNDNGKTKVYDANDPGGSIMCAALNKYLKKQGHENGVSGASAVQVLRLVSGSNTTTLDCKSAPPSHIENYLKKIAPDVGKNIAVTFSGNPDGSTGDWRGQGHAIDHNFTLTGIDEKKGTISYTNPWNADTPHTMKISDFAKNAYGTDVVVSATGHLSPAKLDHSAKVENADSSTDAGGLSDVINKANTSDLSFHGGKHGDGELNNDGADLEKKADTYSKDSTSKNRDRLRDSLATYELRLKYDKASKSTIDAVDKYVKRMAPMKENLSDIKDVNHIIDTANTSGLHFHHKHGDGKLNSDGADVETDARNYYEHNDEKSADQLRQDLKDYTDRLSYDDASDETIKTVNSYFNHLISPD